MKLILRALSPDTRGIYTIRGQQNRLPDRMLRLAPDAAASFLKLEDETGGLVYSDIWRSAESSLTASAEKRGVQPPAFSAHNYGIAFDVAIDSTLHLTGWSYSRLLRTLAQHGWYCHRRDGRYDFEGWHFNFFADRADRYLALVEPLKPKSWARAAEQAIRDRYDPEFELTPTQIQGALQKLGLYHGAIDGLIGPLTRAGLRAFQRAWNLPENEADERTQRTLAFVAADLQFLR